MKISYAITVCNELDEITRLLNFILKKKRKEDEIVILFDEKKGTSKVWSILLELKDEPSCKVVSSNFEGHFADWKNLLTSKCSGDWIFQIDADEVPHEDLIEYLPEIILSNPDNEVIRVPRVNTVFGLTEEYIRQWGWKINEDGWVNWPDFQWRIWKNHPKIKWVNKVHEVLEGYETWSNLHEDERFSLYHPKDIEKQIKQNNYYNTL
jgi:glycosyltransferase involved in cell wall biosynthesis|tara:strand:+ start:776 stop:1399 length:624 start_codon:yes stop_codon:yes gene_type:complete